jgi:hypothetical protein
VRAWGAELAEAESCRGRTRVEPESSSWSGTDLMGGAHLAVRERGREGSGLGRWAGREGGGAARWAGPRGEKNKAGWPGLAGGKEERGKREGGPAGPRGEKEKGRRKMGRAKREREGGKEMHSNAFEFKFEI